MNRNSMNSSPLRGGDYLSQFHYLLTPAPSMESKMGEGIGVKGEVPWVFLHGLMGSGANWRKIITLLSAALCGDGVSASTSTLRTLAFDQRGHGRTTLRPAKGYHPKDYAQDLKNILDELGWTQIRLVGHSMGARNAMWFAALFPQQVKQLVMEDIGPEAYPGQVSYYQGLLDCVPTPFASKLAAREFFKGDFLKTPFAQKMGETLGQYLYSNIKEMEVKDLRGGDHLPPLASWGDASGSFFESSSESSPGAPLGGADWRFRREAILESVAAAHSQDHWEAYESIQCPLLLVRGAQSEELSPSTFQEMQKRNPLCRGIEIPRAGHWVHHDQPLLFVKALAEFAVSV